MRRAERPIAAFRRRLVRLIDDQCAGKYTSLGRRAGIPISTMEHSIHHAKHLPGGEPLLKLAAVLGVSVQSLVGGDAVGPAAEHPAQPTPVVPPRG